MNEKISIFDEFLPEEIRTKYSVTRAYVGKIGFIRLKLKGEIKETVNKSFENAAEDYTNTNALIKIT
jgi:endonuclease III-like uncharacterized protein